MMRLLVATVALPLLACGSDTFVYTDASTGDAMADASPPAEGGPQEGGGAEGGSVPCEFDGSPMEPCTTCTVNGVCCINDGGATCTGATLCLGETSVACVQDSDCFGAGLCCLFPSGADKDGCPHVFGSGSKTTCEATTCLGNGALRVCLSDADCTSAKCKWSTISGTTVRIGVCL